MLDVSHYLPHKPPMVLIDGLESSTDMSVNTLTHITPEAGFYDAAIAGVPSWIGLEYMAQSAAVWVGLDNERKGHPIQPVFLVSSRQYTAAEPVFPLGESLHIQVKVELIEGEIMAFSGRILDAAGQLRAEALFTAYRPVNVQNYLRGERK